uniref:Uncharacterized protein n=1 Tax=Anguilla anguilla TaxID=7936 RepID=A0A0E9RWY5_ANGAN
MILCLSHQKLPQKHL